MGPSDLIIGLGHRQRVGKNTAGRMMAEFLERSGYDACCLAFADPLKETAHTLFSVYGMQAASYYETYPRQRAMCLERLEKTPRQIWIELGNAMRSIAPDVWIEQLARSIEWFRRYRKLAEGPPLAFIITDVRYPDEIRKIREWGGVLVRIVRDSAPVSTDVADRMLADYEAWDYQISNDGNLSTLQHRVAALTSHIIQKGS